MRSNQPAELQAFVTKAYKDEMTGITVLKASHHGRKTGYHQPSVKEMSPWLTITSVAPTILRSGFSHAPSGGFRVS